MKKLIVSLFALAAIGLHAQEAAYAIQNAGVVSVAQVPAASGATFGSFTVTNASGGAVVLDVRKQQNVAIQLVCRELLTDANISNVVYVLYPSVDNLSYATNTTEAVSITNALDGASNTISIRNINCAGVGYYKLGLIKNYSTNILTNIVVKYGIKLHSP